MRFRREKTLAVVGLVEEQDVCCSMRCLPSFFSSSKAWLICATHLSPSVYIELWGSPILVLVN